MKALRAALALAMLLPFLMAAGCGGQGDGVLHWVTYYVVGTEGVVGAEVKYRHGVRIREEPAQLPWTKTVTVDTLRDASIEVRVTKNQLGQVHCAIFRGKQVDGDKLLASRISKRGVNPRITC